MTTAANLADRDSMLGHEMDECPNHGAEVVKEYDFGMMDAVVVKWGCGCCACYLGDSLDDDGTYHANYRSAEGRARLHVAGMAAK